MAKKSKTKSLKQSIKAKNDYIKQLKAENSQLAQSLSEYINYSFSLQFQRP